MQIWSSSFIFILLLLLQRYRWEEKQLWFLLKTANQIRVTNAESPEPYSFLTSRYLESASQVIDHLLSWISLLILSLSILNFVFLSFFWHNVFQSSCIYPVKWVNFNNIYYLYFIDILFFDTTTSPFCTFYLNNQIEYLKTKVTSKQEMNAIQGLGF